MENILDYISIAREIFAGTKYRATKDEIKRLADNMILLERRGLYKLNKRLIDSGRGVWATLAEHNFAVILISRHCSTIPISYEPDILQRPPDFKVEIGDITYWIQMKDLAKLERENRQDKIIQKIKTAAKEVKVGKFFSCKLSDDFKESCLPELNDFIRDKVATATEEESLLFTSENDQKAKIKFWTVNNIELSNLTLVAGGDIEIVDVTGQTKEQIKGSLCNAVRAFTWEVDEKIINLIVMESDNKKDIDICDALFGTEEYEKDGNSGHRWGRKNDGLFNDPVFSKKVAGVIATKRKRERFEDSEISHLSTDAADYSNYLIKECGWTEEKISEALKEGLDSRPIADYHLFLYVNDGFKHLQKNIERLLSFDKVIYFNMRSLVGEGNFRLF